VFSADGSVSADPVGAAICAGNFGRRLARLDALEADQIHGIRR
jgi:hypothetical protein